MSLEIELAEYLSDDGFDRFIKAWIAKYQSLGHLGGKINLVDLNSDEIEKLSGLLGMNLSFGQLQMTYPQFQRSLLSTRFEGVDFFKVLEILTKQKVYSKKEMRQHYEEKLNQFKHKLLLQYAHSKCYQWLKNYFSSDNYVKRYYQDNSMKYQRVLVSVCEALNHLPVYESQYQLLAIFSQTITKDPHYFDEDLPRDLLLKGICFLFCLEEFTKSTENITKIYYEAGILRDDLSNYCYICHLFPENSSSWQGFYNDYEPWNMNLYNIQQVKSVFYVQSVYIFENPSVFRELSLFIKEQQLTVGLISSNGQINLSTYLLLDKLIESGCHLYYAGDFDPEGLLIADKLKQKYNEHLTLYCYCQELFEIVKVHQLEISKNRIQMLNHIQDKELLVIGQLIREKRSFGYQEGLIEIYKQVLVDNSKKSKRRIS